MNSNWVVRLMKWIGDNILGHLIVEGSMGAFFKDSSQKILEAQVNKLTRKDLVLGVVFARLATADATFKTDATAIANGIKKFNVFYSRLRREARERAEKLLYRDVLDAIQEHFKESQIKDEHKDLKTGKVTKVTLTPTNNQQTTFQTYLALLGEAGPEEIELEMDKLEQMSPVKQVANAIGKAGNSLVGGLTSFLNGLNGIKE